MIIQWSSSSLRARTYRTTARRKRWNYYPASVGVMCGQHVKCLNSSQLPIAGLSLQISSWPNSQIAGLVSIPHTDQKISPSKDRTSAAIHIMCSKHRALKRGTRELGLIHNEKIQIVVYIFISFDKVIGIKYITLY